MCKRRKRLTTEDKVKALKHPISNQRVDYASNPRLTSSPI